MKTFFVLLGGVAAGICIGLLIAPAKGSETRKRVAETTSDWAEKLKDLFTTSIKKAKSQVKTGDSYQPNAARTI
ncbi:YtxH domain-containing protein [Niastella caeni]|uniref:YtxH domain-containing protein n=1 Tax=Niastella caeni TaxID=2569763 RepID=A0A4S8HYT9_9BACT|nr:YtxH domain-containing protein [Niastella caeni]THU39334.1 YtxH domain-containing protein [Niastella caeni]